jgi:hypothetical protein
LYHEKYDCSNLFLVAILVSVLQGGYAEEDEALASWELGFGTTANVSSGIMHYVISCDGFSDSYL